MIESELLWRMILTQIFMDLILIGVLLILIIWWLLRKLVAAPSLTVAPDKTSYTRGETVQISGHLSLGGAPVAGETVGLALQPPTGDAISLDPVTTDVDGNFAASWDIAADADLGSYTITATAMSVQATATFTLE